MTSFMPCWTALKRNTCKGADRHFALESNQEGETALGICSDAFLPVQLFRLTMPINFILRSTEMYQGGEANATQAYIGYSEKDLLKPTQVGL